MVLWAEWFINVPARAGLPLPDLGKRNMVSPWYLSPSITKRPPGFSPRGKAWPSISKIFMLHQDFVCLQPHFWGVSLPTNPCKGLGTELCPLVDAPKTLMGKALKGNRICYPKYALGIWMEFVIFKKWQRKAKALETQ